MQAARLPTASMLIFSDGNFKHQFFRDRLYKFKMTLNFTVHPMF